MTSTDSLSGLRATCASANDLGYEVRLTKDLIRNPSQLPDLVVIDRDEDDPVIGQQVSRSFSRGYIMLSQSEWNRPFDFRVCDQPRPGLVRLSGLEQVLAVDLGEVVVVNEVVAGVVRRVDVDQLDLAEVRLLEQLERVEVVALDEEVLRGVEVDGLARGQAGASWRQERWPRTLRPACQASRAGIAPAGPPRRDPIAPGGAGRSRRRMTGFPSSSTVSVMTPGNSSAILAMLLAVRSGDVIRSFSTVVLSSCCPQPGWGSGS